jgi:tetratricopeptide (TPR) repeat protein
VTQNNYVVENALGKTFEKNGDNAKALVLYRDAVKIEPRFANSQYNLGLALIGFGYKDEAFEHLAAAAHYDPNNPDAQYNLGVFFLQNKRWTDAAHCFEATLKLRPDFVPARTHLAEALSASTKSP